jgi:eukaryotic-like serine/threonine-protein kinase
MPDADRVKEIFADALERPGTEREEFVANRCGTDEALRTEVEALLAISRGAGRFLSRATIEPGGHERAGTRIGPYKLLQLIGEGGFGSVFMAEQESPVRRRVALKIIKLGMDTKTVVARFEQERQALAMMDHPNIAKVLDAGATDRGRPYFVMELVKGDPITTYCDKNNLEIKDRLGLLAQVCQAVQHAHTKGVIHRDLKPSNILVATQDGKPLARVIDFGIAKATDHRLTEKTVFTEFRQLIGTPEYMSPEQAEGGLDIDTRTDVYSLGVLLYELLTGTTPFDAERLRSAAWAEMQRIIREVEPPKPSTRLSKSSETLPSIAAHRRTEPRRLGAIMRGELDWIAMKALEKDRSRRYESAGNLGADVLRYLAGEAVTAAPPSTRYRVRKFVRRHRAGVITGGLVFAALVLGMVGTTASLLHARDQRDRAVEAESRATEQLVKAEKARADADQAREESDRFNRIANAVSDFFTLDVLNLKPTPPGMPELTVREVLERVPEKIGQHFSTEPSVEGIIRERVGQLYRNMGQPVRAAEFLERGAVLLAQGLGPENRRTLMARQRLGELYLDLGRYAEAEAAFDQVHQARMRVLGADNNFTWNSMLRRGTARVWGGKIEEGTRDVETAEREFVRLYGPKTRAWLIALRTRIECYNQAGRSPEAERLTQAALEDIRSVKDLAPAEADFRTLLGMSLSRQGRYQDALIELDWALTTKAKGLPPDHPDMLEIRVERAQVLAGLNRDQEALPEFRDLYSVLEPLHGQGAPACKRVAGALADIAIKAGDEPEAAKWRARR